MAMYGEFAHARQVFRAFAPDSEVLVLGSSHPFHAIDPGSAKQLRMWNASFCSGDAWITYHTYLAIREKWPKRPGQIVLFGEDFWEAHLQTEYLRQGFLVAVILHLLIGMPYRNAFLLRDYERTLKKMTSCNNLPPPKFIRGYWPFIEGEGLDAKTRFARHSKRLVYEPTELPLLFRLREAVEADGRRLVYLRTPHRQDYLNEVAASGIDIWAPCAKAREGLPLLDYFSLQPPNARCFANPDHLTPEGANWLTPIVERDLIRLNIH